MISEGTCDVMKIYRAEEAKDRRLRDEGPRDLGPPRDSIVE